MIFTLEALKAKKGDALLLHVGDNDDPALLVIDGGPSGVYRRSLKKRLEAIREARTPDDPLPVRLVMVSHIDDDHIKGILDLTNHLKRQQEDQENPDYRIQTIWHNSFDDIIGNHANAFFDEAASEVGTAAFQGEITSSLPVSEPSALVLVSVPQGRDLRNNVTALGIEVNRPAGIQTEASTHPLIVASGTDEPVQPPLVTGLETIVLGPSKHRVSEFQESWDKEIKKRGLAEEDRTSTAAYLDNSVYNLASIVVLMRAQGKEMLLTGDARGDDILEGLEAAGLLGDDDHLHVDLLKLPHHGSDRNVETDFFRRITADHYIISGDGSHGNPELATFEMLFDARRDVKSDEHFKLYLTYKPEDFRASHGHAYPADKLREMFDEERRNGLDFEVIEPETDDQLSLKIDLLDPYTGA